MTTTPTPAAPDVCSYEGSGYRTDFWEGQGRDYEDRTERVALQRLLPPTGRRLLEVGAGFGRLTNMFDGYEQVILLDYSSTLLREAQAHLGRSERYVYVAANLYQSPINDGVCDAATMIRVLHHMADVPAALAQVRRALAPNAVFVLEFANKRNLKAMLRHALRRQDNSPYALEPLEFIELNFNFHPRYVDQTLAAVNFDTIRKLALSYLRIGALKRVVPTNWLVKADAVLQHTGAWGSFSPSIFTRNVAVGATPAANLTGQLFKCPQCGATNWQTQPDKLVCDGCGAVWAIEDGIYNFKTPL